LTNGITGTITGATGVINENVIGTLSNTGLISGGTDGIDNDYGTIGTLTNNTGGTIAGGNTATENNGLIGTLSNAGLIQGDNDFGLKNTGIITQLANQAGGTIIGGSDANSGVISTLTNSGLITSNENGIFDDYGTIGQLTNNAGGTIIGGNFALSTENGQFGTLTNSGLISGNVGDLDGNLNLVGGTGTIFGTFTNGFIEVPGDVNINLLSGNEILTDNIQALTGNASIGTFTNAGTLQIGTPSAPAAITVKGNYAQTSAGTLNVIVTPAASSQMTVDGNASLAGGVDYIFAPGTYSPKTYNFIVIPQGDGTITGAFTSANYEGTPDTSTTYSTDPSANLVLGAGFTFPGGALTTVSPTDSSIFPDQTQALAQAAQSATSSLLGIAASGGAAAAPACESQAALNPGATNDNANIASAIAAELCNHGGWIEAAGALGHVDGTAGAAGYNANTAGFLAGIDSVFGPANTRLGLAIGYSDTADKAGGKGSMGTTRAALYGAQPLGPILITGVAGYGYANDSTTRATFIGGLKQNDNVNIISLGLQASTAYAMPGFEIIPALGIRYANVGAAHFSESASGLDAAFALTGRTKSFNSLQPYATAELTTRFETPSGYSISPEITLGGQTEAADRGASTSLFAADGTAFTSTHTNPDPFAAILGAGLSASKTNVTFYINYNGLIAGNWNTQTGTAGLRITF
jgi:outer membrane autotransporter protein